MKRATAAVAAGATLLLGARWLGATANDERATWPKTLDPPYAPSAEAAPFLSLGYREMMADLLWIRVVGYVGGDDDQASATLGLAEAIVALDPSFERVYEWSGLAITNVGNNATTEDLLGAIRILQQGMQRFSANYRLPLYAGQIYTVDLHSDDPAQARAWQLAGAAMLERAVRVPGAPKTVATTAAHLRSKLGQRDKAIRDLRELIVYTKSAKQRDLLLAKLAELMHSDAESLRYELEIEQKRFNLAREATRPELPPTMYLLVGPPLQPSFRLEDLAVDRDLIGSDEPIEPLPPIPD